MFLLPQFRLILQLFHTFHTGCLQKVYILVIHRTFLFSSLIFAIPWSVCHRFWEFLLLGILRSVVRPFIFMIAVKSQLASVPLDTFMSIIVIYFVFFARIRSSVVLLLVGRMPSSVRLLKQCIHDLYPFVLTKTQESHSVFCSVHPVYEGSRAISGDEFGIAANSATEISEDQGILTSSLHPLEGFRERLIKFDLVL